MIFKGRTLRGFTLVEVVVAISIVAILASVVIANVGEGRKKARDAQRISDIAQIQLALRLYKDAEGKYPDCDEGMTIGESSTPDEDDCKENIDTALTPFLPSIPKDPLSNQSAYHYVYHSDMHCNALDNNKRYTVIFAQTAEQTNAVNWDDVCGSNGSNDMGADGATTYGIVLRVNPQP
jgi:prepilin-type N-terminal cleavage/methylation domain-containing protein